MDWERTKVLEKALTSATVEAISNVKRRILELDGQHQEQLTLRRAARELTECVFAVREASKAKKLTELLANVKQLRQLVVALVKAARSTGKYSPELHRMVLDLDKASKALFAHADQGRPGGAGSSPGPKKRPSPSGAAAPSNKANRPGQGRGAQPGLSDTITRSVGRELAAATGERSGHTKPPSVTSVLGIPVKNKPQTSNSGPGPSGRGRAAVGAAANKGPAAAGRPPPKQPGGRGGQPPRPPAAAAAPQKPIDGDIDSFLDELETSGLVGSGGGRPSGGGAAGRFDNAEYDSLVAQLEVPRASAATVRRPARKQPSPVQAPRSQTMRPKSSSLQTAGGGASSRAAGAAVSKWDAPVAQNKALIEARRKRDEEAAAKAAAAAAATAAAAAAAAETVPVASASKPGPAKPRPTQQKNPAKGNVTSATMMLDNLLNSNTIKAAATANKKAQSPAQSPAPKMTSDPPPFGGLTPTQSPTVNRRVVESAVSPSPSPLSQTQPATKGSGLKPRPTIDNALDDLLGEMDNILAPGPSSSGLTNDDFSAVDALLAGVDDAPPPSKPAPLPPGPSGPEQYGTVPMKPAGYQSAGTSLPPVSGYDDLPDGLDSAPKSFAAKPVPIPGLGEPSVGGGGSPNTYGDLPAPVQKQAPKKAMPAALHSAAGAYGDLPAPNLPPPSKPPKKPTTSSPETYGLLPAPSPKAKPKTQYLSANGARVQGGGIPEDATTVNLDEEDPLAFLEQLHETVEEERVAEDRSAQEQAAALTSGPGGESAGELNALMDELDLMDEPPPPPSAAAVPQKLAARTPQQLRDDLAELEEFMELGLIEEGEYADKKKSLQAAISGVSSGGGKPVPLGSGKKRPISERSEARDMVDALLSELL